MTEQARVQLGQKCVNQEKEIKQLNRLYMQLAAEKTELNRGKTIAESKLTKKKEKYEELQQKHTVVIKQFQQQIKINQSLGKIIQEIMSMVNTKDGYDKLKNSSNLLETLGIQQSANNNSEMEFDGIMNTSIREPRST